MGKILKIFFIFLLGFNLSFAATSYTKQISSFDRNYKNASSDKLLKYHHMLKNIYIKSIINNDLNLKVKALQRLILTSKKLKLDSNSYITELNTLKKMAGKKGSKIRIVKFPKAEKKVSKKEKKSVQKKKPVGKIAKVVKIIKSSKGISLVFDRPISNIDIKKFALKGKKSYRYVYDVGGILTGRSKIIKSKSINKIRIGQYNKKTIRVVFTHKKRLKLDYTKDDDTLSIGFKGYKLALEKTSSKKQTTSKKKEKEKKYTKTKEPASQSTKGASFRPGSKIIVIDAGHGGKDGGAQGAHGLSEKKIVLQIALKLGRELKSRGYRVYYTRKRNIFVKLRSRTRYANRKKADLFVSIHANAAPNKSKYNSMYGLETFFLSPARSKRSKNVAAAENRADMTAMDYFSKQTYLNFLNREKILAANKLALDVQQSMLNSVRKRYRVKDGGVREAPFWVLVGAQMPAILIETGYITNPTEGKRIASSKYQSLLVNGIANGIGSYFYKNR